MTEENLERGRLNFNVVFRFISLGGGFMGFVLDNTFCSGAQFIWYLRLVVIGMVKC